MFYFQNHKNHVILFFFFLCSQFLFAQLDLQPIESLFETNDLQIIDFVFWDTDIQNESHSPWIVIRKERGIKDLIDKDGNVLIKDFHTYSVSPNRQYITVFKVDFDNNTYSMQFYNNALEKLSEFQANIDFGTSVHNFVFHMLNNGQFIRYRGREKRLDIYDRKNYYIKTIEIFPDELQTSGKTFDIAFNKQASDMVVLTEKKEYEFYETGLKKVETIIEERPKSFHSIPGTAVKLSPEQVELLNKSKNSSQSEKESLNKKLAERKLYKAPSASQQQNDLKNDALINLALVYYDSSGVEQWRNYIDYLYPHKLEISPEGEFIVVISFDMFDNEDFVKYGIYLFNKNGMLINKIDRKMGSNTGIPKSFSCSFSQNSDFCYISNADWIIKIDTQTGNILWEKEFNWETRTAKPIIKTIYDISNYNYEQEEFIFLLAPDAMKKGGQWELVNHEIIILNDSAKVITRKTASAKSFTMRKALRQLVYLSESTSELYFFDNNNFFHSHIIPE